MTEAAPSRVEIARREARAAILASMGHDVSSPVTAEASLRIFEESSWREPVPPVVVAIAGHGAARIQIVVPAGIDGVVAWSVALEEGGTIRGDVAVTAMPDTESRDLDGGRLIRRTLSIDADLPLGYHRVAIVLPSGAPAAELTLIVAPERCYIPEKFADSYRCWGLSVQLYAMRSARSWGIGPSTDSRRRFSPG